MTVESEEIFCKTAATYFQLKGDLDRLVNHARELLTWLSYCSQFPQVSLQVIWNELARHTNWLENVCYCVKSFEHDMYRLIQAANDYNQEDISVDISVDDDNHMAEEFHVESSLDTCLDTCLESSQHSYRQEMDPTEDPAKFPVDSIPLHKYRSRTLSQWKKLWRVSQKKNYPRDRLGAFLVGYQASPHWSQIWSRGCDWIQSRFTLFLSLRERCIKKIPFTSGVSQDAYVNVVSKSRKKKKKHHVPRDDAPEITSEKDLMALAVYLHRLFSSLPFLQFDLKQMMKAWTLGAISQVFGPRYFTSVEESAAAEEFQIMVTQLPASHTEYCRLYGHLSKDSWLHLGLKLRNIHKEAVRFYQQVIRFLSDIESRVLVNCVLAGQIVSQMNRWFFVLTQFEKVMLQQILRNRHLLRNMMMDPSHLKKRHGDGCTYVECKCVLEFCLMRESHSLMKMVWDDAIGFSVKSIEANILKRQQKALDYFDQNILHSSIQILTKKFAKK